MSGQSLLVASGLTKSYGEVLAVDALDLTLKPGTIRGLVGANGAGKTTVLAMLLGLTRPDNGDVTILGQPLYRGRQQRRIVGLSGFIDNPSFYPYLSARRNLAMVARLDGRVPPEALDDALARVGLTEVADAKVRGFSYGMRQRLGLAGALLGRPRVLILDEPTNGLDPTAKREVLSLVQSLADDGTSVLISSHQIEDMDALCHAVTILHCGRAVFNGSLTALRRAAPDPEFLLRTSDRAAALARAADVADVHVVAAAGKKDLLVRGPQPAIDHYIAELVRGGTAVRELRPTATPLERVFLSLTGQATVEGEQTPDRVAYAGVGS